MIPKTVRDFIEGLMTKESENDIATFCIRHCACAHTSWAHWVNDKNKVSQRMDNNESLGCRDNDGFHDEWLDVGEPNDKR